jgi:hypothetical protein
VQFSAERAFVQGLDILQLMHEFVAAQVDLVLRHRVKHERIIGIGRMAERERSVRFSHVRMLACESARAQDSGGRDAAPRRPLRGRAIRSRMDRLSDLFGAAASARPLFRNDYHTRGVDGAARRPYHSCVDERGPIRSTAWRSRLSEKVSAH